MFGDSIYSKSVYTKSKHELIFVLYLFFYNFSKQYCNTKPKLSDLFFVVFLYSNASWIRFEVLVLCLKYVRFQENVSFKYLHLHFRHIVIQDLVTDLSSVKFSWFHDVEWVTWHVQLTAGHYHLDFTAFIRALQPIYIQCWYHLNTYTQKRTRER